MRTDLIAARKALGLTQVELAGKAGTDQSTVSKLENGRMVVTRELAPILANVLNLPILQVLYGSAKPATKRRAA